MQLKSEKISILLVDDDVVDIMIAESEFKKLFEPDTFHFYVASNGVEALNKLYGRNGEQKISPTPSAILVDIRMPKMGGIAFLKELRNDPAFDNVFAYLLTALYGTDEKIASQNLKIAGKIVKPMQHNDALSVYINIVSPHLA